MLFSVIIPVYNVENYLRECVDSIIGQTCKDYELILIDNGSTDSSGAICDEYAAAHDNVKVKHLMPNVMASGARNEGQKLAKGEYILFIDSDDYYANNGFFAKLKEKASTHPDVILFDAAELDERTGKINPPSHDMAVPVEGRTAAEIYKDLIDKDAYRNSAWSKAIKRSILGDNKIYFTPGLSVEDNDWYFNVVLHVKTIAIVDEPAYIYRRRITGSITTTATIKNTIDCLDVIDKWTAVVDKEKENPNSEVILLSLAKQYCNYLIGYSSRAQEKQVTERFLKYDYLLNYSNNKRVVAFRRLKRFFGIKGTIMLLKLYRKIR